MPTPTPLVINSLSLDLPWDVASIASHEILCAFNGEGIVGNSVGPSAGCAHHLNGPNGATNLGYTQDGDALDLDLHLGDSVRSVESGIVRWAKAYTGTKSWSCYGQSVAIDTRLADGSVVTSFYAHLSSIAVKAGTQVGQGQTIGQAGRTGGGTNPVCPTTYDPHLHMALYKNTNYLDASGKAEAATAISQDPATPSPAVTSPPYGGTATLPEPWIDCQRTSLLSSPPVGESSDCVGLHAGDQLTYAPGAVAVIPPATATPVPTPKPTPKPTPTPLARPIAPTSVSAIDTWDSTDTYLTTTVHWKYPADGAQAGFRIYWAISSFGECIVPGCGTPPPCPHPPFPTRTSGLPWEKAVNVGPTSRQLSFRWPVGPASECGPWIVAYNSAGLSKVVAAQR